MTEAVEWAVSDDFVAYKPAVAFMEKRVAQIIEGHASELVWLLEHPPLYTAGTSARLEDVIDPHKFPLHQSGRGGQLTYHGPGQRVAYVMMDLHKRGNDVRCFVQDLERWVIETLAELGVESGLRSGRVGVWVADPDQDGRDNKIAALGIRLRKWVSFHGIALNVNPDLSHYEGIVPCGQTEHGVTSLKGLGLTTTMAQADLVLRETFMKVFDVKLKDVNLKPL